MIFEAKHSLDEREYTVGRGEALDFPTHIHRSFEFFHQLEGSTKISVDGKTYILTSGEAVLIFPFQIHSYTCLEKGEYEMGIFSKELVPDFVKKTEQLLPRDNVFYGMEKRTQSMDNFFLCKAWAYRICGEFDKGCSYVKRSFKGGDGILLKMLIYADEHFCGECSLRETAKAIGYDYAYVSKYFVKKTGMSYNKYVNLLRVSKSMRVLKSSAAGVADIASECGFNTQRSFNRKFFEHTKMTPTFYRNSKN